MKINELTQQAIAYNKEAIEKYFQGVVALQEHAEGVVEASIEKVELIPKEGRQALKGLLKFGREYRESVKTQLARGQEELEKFFPVEH